MKKIKTVIMILLIAVAIIGCKNQINVRSYEKYTETYKNSRASTISFNGFVYNLKMITNIRPR